MAGTRLCTQISFALSVLVLLVAVVDFDAIGSYLQCQNMSYSEIHILTSEIRNKLLRDVSQYMMFPMNDAFEVDSSLCTSPADAETVQLFWSTAVTTESGSAVVPKIRLAPHCLHAACEGQLTPGECGEAMAALETEVVQRYTNSLRLYARSRIDISVVLACSDDGCSETEEVFNAAVVSLSQRVRPLRAVLSLTISTQILRRSLWGLSGSVDANDILTQHIPKYLEGEGSPTTAAFNLFVYVPHGPDVAGGVIKGYTANSQNIGLIVADKAAGAYDISGMLLQQLRAILGISAADDLLDGFYGRPVGAALRASQQAGHREDGSMVVGSWVTDWEVRWLIFAYTEQALVLLEQVQREVQFCCDAVLDWSTLQHRTRLVVSDFQTLVNKIKRSHHDVTATDRSSHSINVKDILAVVDLSNRIISGEHIQKPSLFPYDYRIAVYAPYWVPILVPLMQGVFVEVRRYMDKMHKTEVRRSH